MRCDKKGVAKLVKNTLNKVLSVEANSNSCVLVYQPKVPKSLEKFKNGKKDNK